jgi:hypothetical protein
MLAVISLLYYSNLPADFLAAFPLTCHAAFRALFILPVAGISLIYGPWGGLGTLVLSVLIMLPHMYVDSENHADALLEVLAFGFIGLVIIWMLYRHRRNVSRLRVINAITQVLAESREPYRYLNDVLDLLLRYWKPISAQCSSSTHTIKGWT